MPLTENDNTAGPLTENRSLRTALVVIVIVVVVARQALAQPGADTRPQWLLTVSEDSQVQQQRRSVNGARTRVA